MSRVLWAMADRSGLPAKAFAELDPPAPIDWLKTLTEERFDDEDLARFGVSADIHEKLKMKFSVLRRPTSYLRGCWTSLAGHSETIRAAPNLDRIAWELARWLASHHLDKPELLQWVIERGGHLHPQFAHFVRQQLLKGGLPKPLTTVWRMIARSHP